MEERRKEGRKEGRKELLGVQYVGTKKINNKTN